MEPLTQRTCEQFLQDLASKTPVPGGGGAAALVGAVGAALGNMVGSLTVGKKKYAAVEADIQKLNTQAVLLRRKLEELVTDDAEVFTPLSQTYGLPSTTPEEAAKKAERMEQVLADACSVPMEVMRVCCQALALMEEYAQKGSALAISDAGCGAVFCKAALQAAHLNVLINTKSMADRDRAEKWNDQASAMLEEYCPRADAILQQVAQKLKG